MEIKVQCYKNSTRKNQIARAISIINSVQNYFYYSLKFNLDLDICEKNYINWTKFCRECSVQDKEYIIYITEKPFDDNWFSHEESQYSVITTNKWEEAFAQPSLKAYLIYQIAQSSINFEGDLNENIEMRMVHDFAEGCMFDLCIDKKEIKFGMIAGNICPQCKAVLTRYGIKKALENLKIRCARADDTVSSGQILDNIQKNIERSRFIIAKVDADNLNVYFELGLAMGLDKDVLLISEKNLVLNLPSDLKNWHCMTYEQGNYAELQEKIVRYYKVNYHYK